MKSISTKIKLTAVLAVSVAVGVVLYAKADKVSSTENTTHSAYTIKSSAATNLDASMKAQARALEYTSSEYMSKMAPSATAATDYLAMYDSSDSYQRKENSYARKTAPTTFAKPVPVNPARNDSDSTIEEQRAAQVSNATYNAFGVRSVSTKKVSADTYVADVNATEDAEEVEEPVRKRAVITVDGSYPRRRIIRRDDTDYAKAMDNALANDDAYQVKSVPSQTAGAPVHSGYAVRSAEGRDVVAVQQTPIGRATSEGYSRKAAPQGQSNVNQYAENPTPRAQGGQNYDGYAVRSAGGKDVAATRQTVASSDGSFGGYAVRQAKTPSASTRSVAATATTDGYARKTAPQGGEISSTNLAQYDNAQANDDAYQVKSAPTQAGGATHSGYAVRSAGGKDIAATKQTVASSDENFGGYAVRTAGRKRPSTRSVAATATTDGYAKKTAPQGDGSLQAGTTARGSNSEYSGYAVRPAGSSSASKNMASTTATDGYARRRAPDGGTNQVPVNLAQYDNANSNDKAYQVSDTEGGYAVRSAGGKDIKNTAQTKASTSTEENFGGYTVRSAGVKRTQPTQKTYAQNTPTATPRRTGAPESTGIKKYGTRGQILAANTSTANDRSVIVMPKRGRSITGLVVQDDPGRSIVIQSSTGAQSTYRYGEIDALVNI